MQPGQSARLLLDANRVTALFASDVATLQRLAQTSF
jgi:hypothetical protein